MKNPGEYGQPLIRTTEVHAPVVAGTKTVRLRANGTLPQDNNDPLSTTHVRVINSGGTVIGCQLQECDDYVNGPFTNIGSAMTIVPLGQKDQVIYPKRQYLEVKGLTGSGEIKMTIASQIRYSEMAFDKSDGQYPQGIVGNNIPGWSSL